MKLRKVKDLVLFIFLVTFSFKDLYADDIPNNGIPKYPIMYEPVTYVFLGMIVFILILIFKKPIIKFLGNG